MQRIRRPFADKLMCLYTHHDIRGFDTDYQIIISHPFNPCHLIQGAFHQSLCCHAAISLHQGLLQRSAVDPYPDRHTVFLRLIHYSLYPALIPDISRIDPDLVRPVLNRRNSKPVIEMNIRHQRNMNLLLDSCNRLRRFHRRHGAADDLTPCSLKRKYLRYCSFHIFRLRICHRLNRDRTPSPDHNIPDPNLPRLISIHTSHCSFLL